MKGYRTMMRRERRRSRKECGEEEATIEGERRAPRAYAAWPLLSSSKLCPCCTFSPPASPTKSLSLPVPPVSFRSKRLPSAELALALAVPVVPSTPLLLDAMSAIGCSSNVNACECTGTAGVAEASPDAVDGSCPEPSTNHDLRGWRVKSYAVKLEKREGTVSEGSPETHGSAKRSPMLHQPVVGREL